MEFYSRPRFFLICAFLMILKVAKGIAPVAEWTVKNDKGDTCMKMKMSATMTIPYQKIDGTMANAVVDVPNTASTEKSTCAGDDVSFSLTFFSTQWRLYFDYKKSGSQYKLDKIGNGYTIDAHFPDAKSGGFNAGSIGGSDLPTTKIGNYYGCDNITYVVTGVDLQLSSVKFQPYVQDVTNKGYGQLQVCTTNNGISEAVAILIIIAIALVIIVPIIVTVVCVVRRRRRNNQFGYSTQN